MNTATLPIQIPNELKQAILGIARGNQQFTKNISRQLAAAGVTRDQYASLVKRVQQRLEAVKTLEQLDRQEVRIGELRTQLEEIQREHKLGSEITNRKERREKLKPIEERWLLLATEWAELFTDVIEKRSSVEETMRKTVPFNLGMQLRDALLALAYQSNLHDNCEAAAIAGEITTDELQEIRAMVEQQRDRVNQLDKLACDPTILI